LLRILGDFCGLANRPLYFTAKRLEINSPGLQAWVRKEMKIAL